MRMVQAAVAVEVNGVLEYRPVTIAVPHDHSLAQQAGSVVAPVQPPPQQHLQPQQPHHHHPPPMQQQQQQPQHYPMQHPPPPMRPGPPPGPHQHHRLPPPAYPRDDWRGHQPPPPARMPQGQPAQGGGEGYAAGYGGAKRPTPMYSMVDAQGYANKRPRPAPRPAPAGQPDRQQQQREHAGGSAGGGTGPGLQLGEPVSEQEVLRVRTLLAESMHALLEGCKERGEAPTAEAHGFLLSRCGRGRPLRPRQLIWRPRPPPPPMLRAACVRQRLCQCPQVSPFW